ARLHPDRLLAAWVAQAGNDVVGHVALTLSPEDERREVRVLDSALASAPFGLLCCLFVAPEARGRGAGRRLVEAAMVHAHSRGMALVLDVMLKDSAAIRLYERLGWRHLGDSVHDGGPPEGTPCRWYAWEPR
ncbi:MAG: GNAT family N-acetyltransferase, partial [Actinomycetota bacterium]